MELAGGHIVALEVLDASERLTPEELSSVHYENLLLTEPEVKPRPRRHRAAAARK